MASQENVGGTGSSAQSDITANEGVLHDKPASSRHGSTTSNQDPEKAEAEAGAAAAAAAADVEKSPSATATPAATGKPVLAQTDLDKGIVGWDGQDDPMMPLNFPQSRKWSILGQIAAMSLLSPLSSTLPASGVVFMDRDFHNNSLLLSSFVVSVFVLGYVIGPAFLAPLSEIYGRRPVLFVANWFFVVWQLACALAPNLGSIIAFRLLAGIGAAGCLTLGGGVISDIFIPQERGAANALFGLGALFGPVLGPVVGGFIAERAGWRWTYWVLFIATAAITTFLSIFHTESYAPVILMKKMAKMAEELDRTDLCTCYEDAAGERKTKSEILKHGIVRPLRMLFFSPIVAAFSTYMALVYGLLYLLITTISPVYAETYHWTAEISGLAYLGLGIGFFFGLGVVGATSDRVIVKLTAKNGGVYEPEMRLPFMTGFAFFIPISLFWYGWATDKHTHWIVPLIGLMPFGIGMVAIFLCVQTYIIDAFEEYSASGVAALTISRSLLGALLPLAGPSLYEKLGLGWGNSLLGFLAMAMIPAPYYLWKKGGDIRKNHPIKL